MLQKIGVSWEQQIIPSATLDDIDDNTVKWFLRNAINHKRISAHAASTDTLTLLKNLELINDKGEFLLAALFLSSKELQDLVAKKVLKMTGTKGRGAKYILLA